MPRLPGISQRRAVRAFRKAGFRVLRQGRHTSMPDGRRLIVIPRANPINAFTMTGIVRDAGLTIDAFKKLR